MSTGILTGFALSAFVSITPVDQVYANSTEEAVKHVGKAMYRQLNLDDFVKTLEKKYISEEVLKYGGAIGIGVRIVAEQRVSYTWKF